MFQCAANEGRGQWTEARGTWTVGNSKGAGREQSRSRPKTTENRAEGLKRGGRELQGRSLAEIKRIGLKTVRVGAKAVGF
jgi:hypothetical protein